MKIEKIREERKNNKVVFLLKESNEAFVNAIRRLILEEVPTLAVEDISVKENNSALYDEMLALRLGLIPIKTDLKSYQLKDKCSCNGAGCAQCELKISLKVAKSGYVYARDAKSTDPKCTFVQEDMPIVKLLPKQKIDVVMTAVLGNGKEHAKWAPGWAFYKQEPVISLGKVKDLKKVMDNCKDGVFTLSNNKLSLVKEKVYDSNMLGFYSELDEAITIEYTDNFIFILESWGQLNCKEILNYSADLLLEKAEQLEKEV